MYMWQLTPPAEGARRGQYVSPLVPLNQPQFLLANSCSISSTQWIKVTKSMIEACLHVHVYMVPARRCLSVDGHMIMYTIMGQ